MKLKKNQTVKKLKNSNCDSSISDSIDSSSSDSRNSDIFYLKHLYTSTISLDAKYFQHQLLIILISLSCVPNAFS